MAEAKTTKKAAPKAAKPVEEKPVTEEAKTEAPKAKKATKKSSGNKVRSESTRLLDRYETEVKKALMEKFQYKTIGF